MIHFKLEKINCNSYHQNTSEIYLAANGEVSPCCWLGDLKNTRSKKYYKRLYKN